MNEIVLPIDAFVRAIGVDRKAPHVVFLGAGASVTSGIPSADLCIWEWKRSIFLTNNPGIEKQFSELSLASVKERIQNWLNEKGCYPAIGSPEEYSFYIESCFPITQHRRQFFADKIRLAHPHIGYKLLSLLAEEGIVRSVWTTNFDGLLVKALANSEVTPIEVGIDCQHRAIRMPRDNELLYVSIHGDYRYDKLKNTDDELQALETELKHALQSHLQNKVLIVLGYSGRDQSVMETLEETYSQPGEGGLYWCGYGESMNDSVRHLIQTAKAAGRLGHFVPTLGFDDSLTRLALYCLSEHRQELARQLLSAQGQQLREINAPFAVNELRSVALIKSNAFELDCPSEILEFDINEWPGDDPWGWLERLAHGRKFVAVPHKRKVLALGLLDDIRDAFKGQIKGSIVRTPVTEADKSIEKGVVNTLMRRALILTIAETACAATDGKSCLWETAAYEKRETCRVHRALSIHLRHFDGQLHMVLKPTVAILDSHGQELSRELVKAVKNEVLGYQHNDRFNQALELWRKILFPSKGINEVEFPPKSGSTFRFKIRSAPIFAKIGSRSGRECKPIEKMGHIIRQQGFEMLEPYLLFADRSGNQYARDWHPLRGLQTNRPFDFNLSLHGLAPSVCVGVVCPEKDAQLLGRYLFQSEQIQKPSRTEMDYLIDYPGFKGAFGIPIEVARHGDSSWVECPEPRPDASAREGALNLGKSILLAIDAIVAVDKPHVVLVFIPKRWARWREFLEDQDRFDLHDFVKAYCVQKGIATQFLEEETLYSAQQCRVWWWLSVALYTKAMRTPWVLDALSHDAAYVGLGFSVDHSAPRGNQTVLGCSHLYNSQGEGLQFRLSKIENPIYRGRNAHMSYGDARRLGEMIRQLFFESQLRLPSRVVVHKQTPFLNDERRGLLDGLAGVDSVDLLEICFDAALRYVSSILKEKVYNGKVTQSFDEDNFPVRRGTVVQIDSRKALIWCHGATNAVIPGWRYFKGKRHIPAPLILQRHAGKTDLETLTNEILGLSKMDWNSGDLYSGLPATIHSSRQIAKIGAKLQRFGPVAYDYRLFM